LYNLAGPALPRSKSDREQVVVERRGRRELGTTTGLGRDPTTYRVLKRYIRRGTRTAWLAYRRLSTDFAFRHGMGRIGCTCKRRGNVCMMTTTTGVMGRSRATGSRGARQPCRQHDHIQVVSVSSSEHSLSGLLWHIDVNSVACLRKCMDLVCPGKHDLGTGPAKITVRVVYDAISSV
jgi:hypothetical protein